MEASLQTKRPGVFETEQDDATQDPRHRSSMKDLSKGFVAASSRSSSSSLDDTASNSSLSSSSFSLSSAFSAGNLGAPKHPSYRRGETTTTNSNNNSIPPAASGPQQPVSVSISSTLGSRISKTIHDVRNGGGSVLRQPARSQQQRRRRDRPTPPTLRSILSPNRDERFWEETEDNLYILLDGRLDRLEICRDFYRRNKTTSGDNKNNSNNNARLTPSRYLDLLWSLAYLLSGEQRLSNNMELRDEHVSKLASIVSTGRHPRPLKLGVVQALYEMCLSEPREGNNHDTTNPRTTNETEAGAEKLYEFLTTRAMEWEDHGVVESSSLVAVALVYELRSKCLRNIEAERDRIRSVTDTGDSTAVLIATGAKIVEFGIQKSNKAMEGQISSAGKKMKGWIDDSSSSANGGAGDETIPAAATNNNNNNNTEEKSNIERDAVVVRAFSGSTKRASEYARQSSKRVAQSTVDTTLSGLYTIGTKLEESSARIDALSPESREVIRAAGKIGMASVGAVAVVAEAFIETSRSLSSKAVGVTADIVGHRYGSVAGEVARDAADTYTNVLQTVGNVTLASNGSKLVKTAAKSAGKKKIDEDAEKAKNMILKLEKRGAIVAKHALGIRWAEGSLTKELLCAAGAVGDEDDEIGEEEHESPVRIASISKPSLSNGQCAPRNNDPFGTSNPDATDIAIAAAAVPLAKPGTEPSAVPTESIEESPEAASRNPCRPERTILD